MLRRTLSFLDRRESEEQYRAVGRLGFAGPALSLDCKKPEGPLAEALLHFRCGARLCRLLFLSSAFVFLVNPHAACLLAVSLVLCVQYPGESGGGEGSCNG